MPVPFDRFCRARAFVVLSRPLAWTVRLLTTQVMSMPDPGSAAAASSWVSRYWAPVGHRPSPSGAGAEKKPIATSSRVLNAGEWAPIWMLPVSDRLAL